MMNRAIWYVSLIAVSLGPIGTLVAKEREFVRPRIDVSDSRVELTLSRGQTISRTISLQSNVDLSTVRVWVTPRLRRYLDTPTERIAGPAQGDQLDIDLTVSVPLSERTRQIRGLVMITGAVAESHKHTFRLLPARVTIVDIAQSRHSENGVQIDAPVLGSLPSTTVVSLPDGAHQIDVSYEDPSDGSLVSTFAFYIVPKDPAQPLTEWFSENVDIGGLLQSTGAYQFSSTSSGAVMLERVLPVPQEHADVYGPVSSFYAELSYGQVVVVANSSQAHSLSDFGFPDSSVWTGLLREALGTLVVDGTTWRERNDD